MKKKEKIFGNTGFQKVAFEAHAGSREVSVERGEGRSRERKKRRMSHFQVTCPVWREIGNAFKRKGLGRKVSRTEGVRKKREREK